MYTNRLNNTSSKRRDVKRSMLRIKSIEPLRNSWKNRLWNENWKGMKHKRKSMSYTEQLRERDKDRVNCERYNLEINIHILPRGVSHISLNSKSQCPKRLRCFLKTGKL
ncbi:hypothetical protein NQ317_004928 [Molorchus minor]|uniref:Uncharacterized protein n=1 Tax=Molorchus minor TaxID=1323400 RepID=A0ABQ9JUK2_9CUCU|nr:hypothetical protein NQ317_004928 [Molorchus minor]